MSGDTRPVDKETKKPSRTRLVASVVFLALVVGLVISRWDRDSARRAELGQLVKSGDAAGFNLLLITLDTTRQDHLGCYGYQHAQTPTIDALVTNGIQFDDAVTSCPLTLPSHATMLTGLHPPHHGLRDNGAYHLLPEHTTLAETLKNHGYDTAAFIACFVLDERHGLNQGFDVYDFEVADAAKGTTRNLIAERPADAVTDAVVRWLEQRHQSKSTAPFFAWVHYFDPHMPWQSPIQNSPEFAGKPFGPYDAEIAFVDSQLKRLLDQLDKLKLRERTLIALVSDHGEGLGEHNEPTHGILIYETTMRVAFILSCPTLFEGAYRVDDRVVGMVDLRPTLEDLLGITTTPCDGQSLLKNPSASDRAIYIESQSPLYQARCSPLYGLRRHTDKYILAPEPEYYNFRKDPNELNNLYASAPSELDDLEQELSQLLRSFNAKTQVDRSIRTMSRDEIDRLAALGYVHSNVRPSASADLPDPKAMMPKINQAMKAYNLFREGKAGAALSLALKAVEGWDAYARGQHTLAKIYIELNRLDEAVDVLRRSAKVNPQSLTYAIMGDLLIRQERYVEADTALTSAQALNPYDGRIPMTRGDLFIRLGHHQKAIALYKEAIQLDDISVGRLAREKIREATTAMELANRARTTSTSP